MNELGHTDEHTHSVLKMWWRNRGIKGKIESIKRKKHMKYLTEKHMKAKFNVLKLYPIKINHKKKKIPTSMDKISKHQTKSSIITV